MNSITNIIEQRLKNINMHLEEIDGDGPFSIGFFKGQECAYQSVLYLLEELELIPGANDLYEILKDLRYDKNGSGAFSHPLGSEFTDYALKDIAQRLNLALQLKYKPIEITVTVGDNEEAQNIV